MSELLLITESLDPESIYGDFSLRLAGKLRDQQVQLTLLTSEDQIEFAPDNIQAAGPFKTWGFREWTRAMALVEFHRPKVIQIIQPHGQLLKRWMSALAMMQSFSQMRFQTQSVLSLVDPQSTYRNRKSLLQHAQLCRVVTVTHPHLFQDLNLYKLRPRVFVETLPLIRAEESFTCEPEGPFSGFKPYVFLPGGPDRIGQLGRWQNQVAGSLCDLPEFNVLFGGAWAEGGLMKQKQMKTAILEWPDHHRYFVTGKLTREQRRQIISEASLVCMQDLQLSDEELYVLGQDLNAIQTPYTLSSVQRERTPGLWSTDDVHVGQGAVDKEWLTGTHLRPPIQAQDESFNRISRIYSQLGL